MVVMDYEISASNGIDTMACFPFSRSTFFKNVCCCHTHHILFHSVSDTMQVSDEHNEDHDDSVVVAIRYFPCDSEHTTQHSCARKMRIRPWLTLCSSLITTHYCRNASTCGNIISTCPPTHARTHARILRFLNVESDNDPHR
jgi:hypothetical protein